MIAPFFQTFVHTTPTRGRPVVYWLGFLAKSWALLENVSHLLAKPMRSLLQHVLREFHARGFVVQWATVTGKMCGIHVWRERVFLLAFKQGVHIPLLQDHRLLTAEEIEAESNSIWNRKGRIPLWTWLSDAPVADSKQRLKMLGNAVMPRCGRLALHLMLHQHQK